MPLFGPPDIPKLQRKRNVRGLIRALRHRDAAIREDAADALGQLKHGRAVMPLIAALNDADDMVREAAVEALGEMIDHRAVEPLISALRDRKKNVRRAAVEVLGRSPYWEDQALVPLSEALSDRSKDVRLAAEIALELKDAPTAECKGPAEKHFLANHITLDLETARGPDEVGGWVAERMGLAVAVTWDQENGFREWYEEDVEALVGKLSGFGHIVGFNLLDFDYRVLAAYQPAVSELLRGKTVDILADVHRALGFRISLDDLARETLGRGKTGTGGQALQWWKQGQRDLVVQYCRSDVELTRDLYTHGVTHGVIYYPSYGSKRAVKVNW